MSEEELKTISTELIKYRRAEQDGRLFIFPVAPYTEVYEVDKAQCTLDAMIGVRYGNCPFLLNNSMTCISYTCPWVVYTMKPGLEKLYEWEKKEVWGKTVFKTKFEAETTAMRRNRDMGVNFD